MMPDWPDPEDEDLEDDEWGGPYEISGEPDGFMSIEDDDETQDEE